MRASFSEAGSARAGRQQAWLAELHRLGLPLLEADKLTARSAKLAQASTEPTTGQLDQHHVAVRLADGEITPAQARTEITKAQEAAAGAAATSAALAEAATLAAAAAIEVLRHRGETWVDTFASKTAELVARARELAPKIGAATTDEQAMRAGAAAAAAWVELTDIAATICAVQDMCDEFRGAGIIYLGPRAGRRDIWVPSLHYRLPFARGQGWPSPRNAARLVELLPNEPTELHYSEWAERQSALEAAAAAQRAAEDARSKVRVRSG